MNWKKYERNSADDENIDQSRLYIVHCPGSGSVIGYEVASWDGNHFVLPEGSHVFIDYFVESYAVLQEVDEDA